MNACIANVKIYPTDPVGGPWINNETWEWNNPIGGEVVRDGSGNSHWWDIGGGWGDVLCSDFYIWTKTVWADVKFSSHFGNAGQGNFGRLHWDQWNDSLGLYVPQDWQITVPQYVTEMHLFVTISGSQHPCAGQTMVPCVTVLSTNPPG